MSVSVLSEKTVKKIERKNAIIDELFRLDPEIYLELPLYKYRLPDLERMYINEKCKPVHAFRYRNGDLL